MSDLVNPKNTLATSFAIQSVENEIIAKVSPMVVNQQDLKCDIELVKYVANHIETMILDKAVDKPSIIFNIMVKLFPTLTSSEQDF